ncbi:hypothetical protein [Haloferula sp. BvORR071]|uniref:hypothetical protein n=1 Tax=Haloferula sp. BvORR071 TaxID=1396141 RepID=UPI0005586E0B|nr:hypothetical protein [Haloferula sp. BvORR071]
MSFSDLLSSGRGPGVIGTFLALLVLVGFGTLYIFVFDEGLQGGKQTIESMIREQGTAIEIFKEDIKIANQRLEEAARLKDQGRELSDAQAKASHGEAQIDEAEAAKRAAGKAVDDANQKWEDYKAAYRTSEWGRAKGEKLGDVTSLSGTTYHDVSIREVNHTEMKITDSTGPKSIKMKDLPLALQDRWQPDEKTAVKVAGDRNKGEQDHVNSVEYATTEDRRDQKQAELDKEQMNAHKEEAAAKAASDAIPVWENSLAQQRTAIDMEKRKKLSKAPAMEARLQEMEGQARENKNSISQHQQKQRDAENKVRTLQKEIDGLNADLVRIAKEYAARNKQGTDQK